MNDDQNESASPGEQGWPVGRPSNRISDISTEYSQIINVLSEPLPLPRSSDGTQLGKQILAARQQQLAERQRFIERYQKAVMAFLKTKMGDAQASEAVWDLFVEKCMAGKLGGYDPSRSFRTYLKTVLRNTCYEYLRKKPQSMAKLDSMADAIPDISDSEADEAFDRTLVQSLFNAALSAVRTIDVLQYVCLKLNAEALSAGVSPPSTSELAKVLSLESGRTISRDNAKQIKSRASKQFSKQLIDEVAKLICSDDLGEVEATLGEMGILKYCKNALQKRRAES